MNQPVLFVYRKMKENDKVSRAKNPKYESMSLEELKANMEKGRWWLLPQPIFPGRGFMTVITIRYMTIQASRAWYLQKF